MKFYLKIILFIVVPIFAYSNDSLQVNYSGRTYFTSDILNNELSGLMQISDKGLEEFMTGIINRLLGIYSEKGFPLAEIKADSLINLNGKMILYLNINSGEYIKYDQIVFRGNKTSRNESLLKQTGIKPKSRFSEAELNEACDQLYKTQLFKEKPEFQILHLEKKYAIQFTVDEKKFIQIMIMGGYSAGGKSESFSGQADIKADNIFGTLRKAQIRWERHEGENEKIKLMYKEPFLFSYHISTSLEFEQNYKKGYFLSRKYGFDETFDINSRSAVIAGITRENIYTDSLFQGSANDMITDRYSGGFTYASEYISEAVPRNSGFSVDGGIASLNVDVNDSASVRGSQFNLTAVVLQKIRQNYFIRMSALYDQVIFKDNISEFNKIYFGGASSLRGYREEFFISDIFIKQSADLYFVPDPGELALNLFFENAFYNSNSENIQKITGLSCIQSYGGGIIIQFGSGEISALVGIPAETGFADGVIHVRYTMRF